jgi:hypothetical protein
MKTRSLPLSSLFLTFLTFFVASVATAQVPSYVPTNGLVGYWPFNGNANDESGNGNNGTVNGATLTADRFGDMNRAFNFDGVNDYIFINDAPSLSITGDITISAWKWEDPNSNNGYHSIVTKRLVGDWGYNIAVSKISGPANQELDRLITGRRNNDGAQSEYRYSDQLASEATWQHVVVTISNNLIKFYIDGNDAGNGSNGGNVFTIPAQNQFVGVTIGDCYCNNNEEMQGFLDDIGIWNRALTADEVLALYNGCNVTPIAIAGSNTPGAFTTSNYTCNNIAGSTYDWTVSNGVITSGQGTNSVSILWGAEGVGSVSVVETTADGCVGDAVIYDVNVQCVVSGNAIEGPVGPEAFSNSTYTCNGAANSTYQWTITNGVIVSGQGTNSVNILWASTGIGNISVVETTYEGCVGTTLSQDVVVIPTNVEELSNALILYPNPATTELNLQTTTEFIGSDLIIFDALGKQIHKQQILSTNTRISTSAFAAGNYVVKVGEGVKRFEVVK